MTRENLMNGLSRLFRLLSQAEAAQREYEVIRISCLGQASSFKKPLGHAKYMLAILTPFVLMYLDSIHSMLASIALLALGAVMLLLGVVALVRKRVKTDIGVILVLCAIAIFAPFITRTVLGSLELLLSTLVVAVGLAVGTYNLGSLRDVHLTKVNEKIALKNQEHFETAYRAAAPDLSRIENKVAAIQEDYRQGQFEAWFPSTYLTPEATSAFWHIINNGRADTLKEAINWYSQDMHNEYLRSMANQQAAHAQMALAEQRRTTQAVQIGAVMNVGMQEFQGAKTRSML